MLQFLMAADLAFATPVRRWDEQSQRAAQYRHEGLALEYDPHQSRLTVGCGSSPATVGTASEIYRSLIPVDDPFEITRSRVLNLYQGDPEEHPDPAAFAATWNILDEARSQMSEFPRGAACSDLDGGIRVEWSRGQRRVRLVISAPGGRKPCIYQSEGDAYRVVDASSARLAAWLTWLGHG